MKSVSRIVPPKDIEDIVQETYVRVCQIDSSSSIKHPRSFLFKTARNLALDHVKRAESRLTTGVTREEEFDDAMAGKWKEIAKTLGIAESTVEKHIANGVKRCTKLMMSSDRNFELDQAIGLRGQPTDAKVMSMNAHKRGL